MKDGIQRVFKRQHLILNSLKPNDRLMFERAGESETCRTSSSEIFQRLPLNRIYSQNSETFSDGFSAFDTFGFDDLPGCLRCRDDDIYSL